MSLTPAASQTAGPFFSLGLTTNRDLGVLAREGAAGERIRLEFRITDGDGAPTPGDSMIELWQADAQGRYAHELDPRSPDADPHFRGFGRLDCGDDGRCTFETVKPGGVPDGKGELQAPHINVMVFARGLLKHLYTRVYFAGEPANAADPVLAQVPEDRRATLVARPVEGEPGTWRFDVRLQGEGETVFFDV